MERCRLGLVGEGELSGGRDGVHHGLAAAISEQRAAVLAAAYAVHSERFIRTMPRPPEAADRRLDQRTTTGGDDRAVISGASCLKLLITFQNSRELGHPLHCAVDAHQAVVDPVRQRQRRYDTMVSLLHLGDDETVLSVGGGEGNSFEKFNRTNPVTGIDLFETSRLPDEPRFQYVQRTSDAFPFGDGQFDVVVCIGVLEHISDPDVLAATCREIRRVGRRYLVLVPHYWTLVEPHYGFPLFQHLPVRVQAKMTTALGLQHAPGHAAHECEVLNYFPTGKWLSYFPSAHHRTYWHIGPMISNLIMLGHGAETCDGKTYPAC